MAISNYVWLAENCFKLNEQSFDLVYSDTSTAYSSMIYSGIILIDQPDPLRSPSIRLRMRRNIRIEHEVLRIVYAVFRPRLHPGETALSISHPEAVRILIVHKADPAAVHQPGNFRMGFWLILKWRQGIRRHVADTKELLILSILRTQRKFDVLTL